MCKLPIHNIQRIIFLGSNQQFTFLYDCDTKYMLNSLLNIELSTFVMYSKINGYVHLNYS